MTVSTTNNKTTAIGNGVIVAFSFSFKYFNASDVDVYVNGALIPAANYTLVKAASGIGGTVTFNTAPANNAEIVILRDLPYTQESVIPTVDKLSRGLIENAIDKMTMLIQQLKDTADRALTRSVTALPVLNLVLPEPAAGKVLAWKATEDGLENVVSVPAGTFPSPTGQSLKVIRVDSGGVGYELTTALTDLVSDVGFLKTRWFIHGMRVILSPTPGTIIIAPGVCADSTGNYLLEFLSNYTLDPAITGLGGVDTGAISNGLWRVYVCYNPTTNSLGAVLSLSSTYGGVVFPAGYTVYRKMPVVFPRLSGAWINVDVVNWPRPHVIFVEVEHGASVYRVLDNGTASSFSDVPCSSLVPNESQHADVAFEADYVGSAASAYIRVGAGSSVNGFPIVTTSNVGPTPRAYIPCVPLTSAGVFDYKWNSAAGNKLSAWVHGYQWMQEL